MLAVSRVTPRAIIIRVERHEFEALPGQHVTLGVKGAGINREYSIYARPDAPELSFLVKVGATSETALTLQRCREGDVVDLAGPYGEFLVKEPEDTKRRYLFVATGVGIAPFHCFTQCYPQLDYRLIHGVSQLEDRYDMEAYGEGRYVSCVTRESGGDYRGRVTDYLVENPVESDLLCYICGHSTMVADVYDILRAQGVSANNLSTEVFF